MKGVTNYARMTPPVASRIIGLLTGKTRHYSPQTPKRLYQRVIAPVVSCQEFDPAAGGLLTSLEKDISGTRILCHHRSETVPKSPVSETKIIGVDDTNG